MLPSKLDLHSLTPNDLMKMDIVKPLQFEIEFRDIVGIFEVNDITMTFGDFMPRIAVFMKSIDRIFLMDKEGVLIPKSFNIWETL